jgi:hypothetical protein
MNVMLLIDSCFNFLEFFTMFFKILKFCGMELALVFPFYEKRGYLKKKAKIIGGK